MVKTALAKAAQFRDSITDSVGKFVEGIKKPKIDERRLLIVFTDKEGKIQVLGETITEGQPSRFKIEKGKRTMVAVQELMRDALPLFHELNMEFSRCNLPDFISNHIEYDVVRTDIYNFMGIPKDKTAEECLKDSGFTIIPLEEHPLRERLDSIVGRP